MLGLLFGQPARNYLGKELITLTDAGTGATHRFVQRLVHSGLVQVRASGRQKFHQANPTATVYQELVALIRKTAGLHVPAREALTPFASRLQSALIYGSAASEEDHADSDIDVLVVSDDLGYPTMLEALGHAERELGRKVSPRLMRTDEWRSAVGNPDRLLRASPHGCRST